MKPMLGTILIVILMTMIAGSCYADGLLGREYIGFEVGVTKPGDDMVEEVDDSILGVGGAINLPLSSNLDFNFSIGYSKAEGDYLGVDVEITATTYLGRLLYHFTPEQSTNPFIVVGVGLVQSEVEAKLMGFVEEEDEDDTLFTVAAGVEVNLSDKSVFRPGIGFATIDDEDDFNAGAEIIIWVDNAVFVSFGGSYWFDSEDMSGWAGLGVGF